MMVSTRVAENMVTLVSWEQVMPTLSKSDRLYHHLTGHQKKSLVVKRFPAMKKFAVVMTVLGMDAKM